MSKRNLDSVGGEGIKKTRTEFDDDVQQVRLLIENHEAGAVIGKGGCKVNEIRTATSCSINILKNEAVGPSSKERILVLKGSVEGNGEAIKMMTQFWLDAASSRAEKAGTGETVTEYTVKLLVHKFSAGCIIGKGGARIKQMIAETGCHIQLSNDALPGSTEKSVSLKGTLDQICGAVQQILFQLSESPLKPGSSTIQYVPGSVGGGGMAPRAPEGMYDPYAAMGGYGGFAPPAPQGYGAPAGRSPYGVAPGGYGAPPSPSVGYGAPAPSSYGGPPASGGSSGGAPEKILVPSLSAGAIIGRGGAKIRELNAQSGCTISLSKPDPSKPDERIVTISGDPQNIQTAIYMIRQIVEQGF